MKFFGVLTSVVAFLATSAANAATFNFEDATSSNVTSYTATNGGITLSLSRTDGSAFTFQSIGVSGYGNETLSPFNNINGGAFVATFSKNVSDFSISYGDFLPSDLDDISISAYTGANGTGSLIEGFSTSCCQTGSGFASNTNGLIVGGIKSVVFSGGSAAFPQSIFWDNLTVSSAPETSTWAMMMLGFAGIGFAGYRTSRKGVARAV